MKGTPLLLLLLATTAFSQSPCDYSLFIKLKEKPLTEMTDREYDYFKNQQQACNDDMLNENDSNSNETQNISFNWAERYKKQWGKRPFHFCVGLSYGKHYQLSSDERDSINLWSYMVEAGVNVNKRHLFTLSYGNKSGMDSYNKLAVSYLPAVLMNDIINFRTGLWVGKKRISNGVYYNGDFEVKPDDVYTHIETFKNYNYGGFNVRFEIGNSHIKAIPLNVEMGVGSIVDFSFMAGLAFYI